MRRSDLDALTKMIPENDHNHNMKKPVAVEPSLLPAIGVKIIYCTTAP